MVVYSRPTDKCMVRWAKPKGAFERVGCNLRLSKRLLNMVSTLPADPAGFDLEFFSKGGPGSAPGSQGRKTSPKRCLRQNHSYIVHMVGLEGIVPQLSGPGGCGMGGAHQTINKN